MKRRTQKEQRDKMTPQQALILERLMLGHEIHLGMMWKVTTKLSTRCGELSRYFGIEIEKGWKRLSKNSHPVRTYKLK